MNGDRPMVASAPAADAEVGPALGGSAAARAGAHRSDELARLQQRVERLEGLVAPLRSTVADRLRDHDVRLVPKSDPDGWGNRVSGRCPACGGSSLFVAVGGHVTCARADCPAPTAVADQLLANGSVPRVPSAGAKAMRWVHLAYDAGWRISLAFDGEWTAELSRYTGGAPSPAPRAWRNLDAYMTCSMGITTHHALAPTATEALQAALASAGIVHPEPDPPERLEVPCRRPVVKLPADGICPDCGRPGREHDRQAA